MMQAWADYLDELRQLAQEKGQRDQQQQTMIIEQRNAA
jgi:hypothetical protein